MSESDVREDSWLNYRELDEADLENLAVEIVRQVRERGPFLNLADFVNRRLGEPADGQGLQGALAQAIDDAGVNANSIPGQLDLPPKNSGPGDSNWSQVVDWYIEDAVIGSRSAGATRWLMQGDLLSNIGGMIATRSDTFMIRSFGSNSAEIGSSEIFLEAVVRRVPEAVEPDSGDPFAVGNQFGRRFELVSYRVLDKEDI